MANNLRAAWVPDDDPHRDLETAAQIAADWISQECTDQHATGILVMNALGAEESNPALRQFAAKHTRTTPRVRGSFHGVGPTLAYVPSAPTLHYAAGLARGSSIAVVEGRNLFPLQGWARALGAVDLTRPDELPAPIEPELAEPIDRLLVCSNNGFGDNYGKQQARRILEELRDEGLLHRDFTLGALLAYGVSDNGIRNLAQIIQGVQQGR